ncbi:MAG: M20 family metallopeptidase [Firmicutes bacterium]|nr:M20 family metallopeptidase [Bacillota bacterium]MDY2818736.1 M20 family metallopeptidase [Hominisplanchenecus sp.]
MSDTVNKTAAIIETVKTQAAGLQDEITAVRREIHRFPERGQRLPKTKAFVMEKLREYGYEPKEICESGIVAEISGKQSGRTLLLRADMDALPVEEKAECDFRSENDCMHACGHDMHTAMLLGAAKLLRQNQDLLQGTVKLVFQPDEEGFTGAKAMLAAGVLENPKVDAGIALHVNSGTPSGMVLCGKGTCMAGCTLFRITVKGKGCHGAMPETGVDPINIAAHIYLALQEIVAREVAAMEPVVVTIGKFQSGDVPNVIPQEAVLEGTIRYMKKEMGEEVLKKIRRICELTAQTFRGTAEVTELASAPPLINDRDMAEEISSYTKQIVGENRVYVYENGGMGSEDFASYTYQIPCTYMLLGAGTKEEDPRYGKPMHNEKVVFNEEILQKGAAIHTCCAILWLEARSRQ